MVESVINLDLVFASLSDATRRDILARVLQRPRTVGELAEAHMQMSFAAIAKHVSVLERALLVVKKREGRHQIVSANPATITATSDVLRTYQTMLNSRFDALDTLLQNK